MYSVLHCSTSHIIPSVTCHGILIWRAAQAKIERKNLTSQAILRTLVV
jgi:hypothetical protein